MKQNDYYSDILQCKCAATPKPTCMFNTTCESFQMRYCTTFHIKGHQNYYNLKTQILLNENINLESFFTKTSGKSDAP